MPLNHPDIKEDRKVDGYQILAAVNEAFERDPAIEELGMLFLEEPASVADAQAASGAEGLGLEDAQVLSGAVVLIQHKIAIAYWCIPALFSAARKEFKKTVAVDGWWRDAEKSSEVLRNTRALLLVAADTATAWNSRKLLICEGSLSREEEVKFVNLVQTKHHKSQEVWAHRKWVVQPLLSSFDGTKVEGQQDTASAETCIQAAEVERKACSLTANLYRKNYNSWAHRLWVANLLPAELLMEWATSLREEAKLNVSDSALQHFRVSLLLVRLRKAARTGTQTASNDFISGFSIVNIYRETGSDPAFASEMRQSAMLLVQEEIDCTIELVMAFPGHESLWNSLRCLWVLEFELATVSSPGSSQELPGPTGGLADELREWHRDFFNSNSPEVFEAAARDTTSVECGSHSVAKVLTWVRKRVLDKDCADRDSEEALAWRTGAWFLLQIAGKLPSYSDQLQALQTLFKSQLERCYPLQRQAWVRLG